MKKAAKPKKNKPSTKNPWWSTAWGWTKATIGFGGVIFAYVNLIPQFSPQQAFSEDSRNPFSQAFNVENQGWLQATDLSVKCRLNTILSSGGNASHDSHIGNASQDYYVIKAARYKVPVTLPCDRLLAVGPGLGPEFKDSTLEIALSYHIQGTWLHNTQTFAYGLHPGHDGKYHWRAE